MKKFIIILLLLTIAGCQTKKDSKNISIGLIQIAEHSSLDELRKGITDELKSKYGDNVTIDYKNAQGDMNTLNTIAQRFVMKKVDLIIGIATPSAQAAYSATQNIPIIFSAVTDPIKAGIIKDLNNPQTNVSGTMDVVDIKKEFELLKKLVPNSQKVGILYNTSEVNSETMIKEAKEVAKTMDLEIITQGVSSSQELAIATESLLKKVDSLFIPTDNLITTSLPLILEKTNFYKIPVIGSAKGHVEQGALGSYAIDHVKLGKDTALMVIRVLEKEDISKMKVEKSKDSELIINKKTALLLGIDVSTIEALFVE